MAKPEEIEKDSMNSITILGWEIKPNCVVDTNSLPVLVDGKLILPYNNDLKQYLNSNGRRKTHQFFTPSTKMSHLWKMVENCIERGDMLDITVKKDRSKGTFTAMTSTIEGYKISFSNENEYPSQVDAMFNELMYFYGFKH